MPNELTSEGVLKISSQVRNPAVPSVTGIKRPDSVPVRQELPDQTKQEEESNKSSSATDEKEIIQKNVEHINAKVQNIQRDLQFSVDDESGRTIIRVIDSETQETIRVIPPEDINGIAQRLTDSSGVLFNSIA